MGSLVRQLSTASALGPTSATPAAVTNNVSVWPVYRNATDENVKSIFAYLRTIKPIVNHVPDYKEPPGLVLTTQ